MIRVVPIDRLSMRARLRLRWPRFARNNPITGGEDTDTAFMIVALEGRRVVGYWRVVEPKTRGAHVTIDSVVTQVVRRLHRHGIAWRLWQCGVTHWGATRVIARAGTDAGANFMARAALRLAARGVVPVFEYNCCGNFDDWAVEQRTRAALLAWRRQKKQKPRKRKARAA